MVLFRKTIAVLCGLGGVAVLTLGIAGSAAANPALTPGTHQHVNGTPGINPMPGVTPPPPRAPNPPPTSITPPVAPTTTPTTVAAATPAAMPASQPEINCSYYYYFYPYNAGILENDAFTMVNDVGGLVPVCSSSAGGGYYEWVLRASNPALCYTYNATYSDFDVTPCAWLASQEFYGYPEGGSWYAIATYYSPSQWMVDGGIGWSPWIAPWYDTNHVQLFEYVGE